MKQYHLILIVLSIALAAGCASKKEKVETAASQKAGEWPEMESFHMVMAEAYHPFKDSANLEPVKRLAEDIAKESSAWAAATLPEAVNNENMKSKLEKLKSDSRTLADQIKSGATDEQIGTSLTALHESFHGIMEAWHR